MRRLAASTTLLFALSACPADDDDTNADTSASTNTASTTATTTADTGSSSGATTAPGESSSSEGGMAGPPVINSIIWTQADGCMMGTISDVDVVVDVSDPDNDVSELTFTGMPIGCTGEINAPMVTIQCPQVSTYMATVKVEDPDGNSDQLPISIMICMDGMVP